MAEDILVNSDVERGAALVRALDDADFPVIAALWLYYADIENWRLVIATPKATSPQEAYVEIRRVAEHAEIESLDLAQIRLVLPSEPIVTTLSKAVRLEGLGGVRFSRNMIDGIYVDDAYVYRAAA
jgi:hypothetical protein